MADYAHTPLARKLGIVAGSRVRVVSAPRSFIEKLAPLPRDVDIGPRIAAPIDVAVLFCQRQAQLMQRFWINALAITAHGGIWVAWPKKQSALSTDLDFDIVQRIGLDAGLVDNKSCAIDDDWSALRFVVRRENRGAWPPR